MTVQLDDVVFDCRDSSDAAVREISRVVYCIYDDVVEHPISVTAEGWGVLRRVLAFLSTELDIEKDAD